MAAHHRGASETRRDTTGRFTARHITMTGATATVPRGPRSLATLAAAMLATLLIAVVAALPASAVAWDGMATMKHYAYVTTDEDLEVYFGNPSVTVRDPLGNVVYECHSGGSFCEYRGSATVDGVWVVEASNTTDNTWAVRVQVRNSTTNDLVPGRVWAENIAVSDSRFRTRNFTVYYVSEFGVQYRAAFSGHIGWVFKISASNRGVMFNDGSCLPAYRSVPEADYVEPENPPLGEMSGADYTLDGGCESMGLVKYRLFFGEEPAADLPASAEHWGDGRTAQTWVLREYQEPVISGLGFTRPGSGIGGTITGELTGQPGVLRTILDFDGDDVIDPEDRVWETAAGVGAFAIAWEGLDGLGEEVPRTQGFTLTVELTGEAEIHFVDQDVEGRTGGIAVTRLNGPNAPDTRISWDDSLLPGTRNTVTAALTGSLVDSTGGVHGWAFDGNGWGNARIIDDWMFIYPSAAGTIIVPAGVDDDPELADTGADLHAGTAATAAALVVLGGAALVAARRRG
ncbi:MAG: hypothetical protein DIU73_006380 [Actinomycetes bacterium]